MKIKTGNALAYKDPELSVLYGVGVVMAVTDSEYTILWARRGSRRYRRSILDQKLSDVFQREDSGADSPKERHLQLGASKDGIPFNENFDRIKVKLLCESLQESRAQSARSVADGLAGEMFTNKLALRAATKAVLLQLAELCSNQKAVDASNAARQISKELFFGYVIQKTDFSQ